VKWRHAGTLVALTLVVAPVADTVSVGASIPGRASATGGYRGFSDPQAVTIAGYAGTAMEPFISTDGRYLLFNTSNQAPDIPAIQYATSVNSQSFTYQGQVGGVNEAGVLSGTPSMDEDGNFYFVSTRSYDQTLSTVYTGQFDDGQVSDVRLVPGVSGSAGGIVDFDADVSPDGQTLYVSVGKFVDGSGPTSARLALFDKTGSGFVAAPQSSRLLRAVNKKKTLNYAGCISSNGLELFFTRLKESGGEPAIYRAVRTGTNRPFGHVQPVAAITGFAEAPSLSADGSTLYYHLLVGDQFDIEDVTRPPPSPPALTSHQVGRPRSAGKARSL
jgi:Tol biopolymer transport system component